MATVATSPAPVSTPILSAPIPVQVPVSRLSPALVDGVRVWVECPAWCIEDHVAANQKFLADVDHGGEMVDLVVPDVDGEVQLLGHVRLSAEPGSSRPELRRPHLLVEDGSGFTVFVTLEDASDFADGLVTAAERMRAMVRAAG
ncbi:DUF6907 domain-containing protein [Streptomyces sp. NBC_01022]|uniref:DUF6907 domain-containing protein n=1 Tax=Streptomyces sp. NBC_01022 TaxID=2903723 RepID=UPI002DDB2C05|nr:hypothetical protein [Streptomyces sp. NBC_01022]WRZ84821.1 hypothetical protein OG316_33455 [Streptomyces sp. NBC_01022]